MFYPPNPTEFFATVWEIVQQIPPGSVSSYGQIASMFPPSNETEPVRMRRLAPRWVGAAMRKTPRGKSIPWHRVINSRGAISFPAGSAQADEQRRRLEMEGVAFDANGRVSFARVGWRGPDAAFLQRLGLLPPRPLK